MSLFTVVAVLGLAHISSLASASLSFIKRTGVQQPPCVYPYTEFVYSGCYADAVFNRSLPFETKLEFNNATVEQCTSWCKGNNYRYAGLEYYGQCFCGASVFTSKASEIDCNLPCNGDKTQACGGLDRISIFQDPTFPDADDIAVSSEFKSLGCYTEGTSGRSLIYSQWDFLNPDTMTTEACLNQCGSKGYPFAGTEFGRECYCGVVLGNGTEAASPEACSTPCSGNSTEFCGGPSHLSLYVAKNLESTEPCAPPVISSSSSIIYSSTSIPFNSSSSITYSSTSIPVNSTSSSPTATSSSSSSSYSFSSSKTISKSSSKLTSSSPCKTSTRKPSSTKSSSSSCKTTPKKTSSTKKSSTSTKKISSSTKVSSSSKVTKTSSATKKTSSATPTTKKPYYPWV